MKTISNILIIITILLLTIGGIASAQTEDEAISTARQLLQSLVEEDFDGAVAMFDDAMLAALPLDIMEETWGTLIGQVGEYQGELAASVEEMQGLQVVTLITQFEAMALDAIIAVNSDDTIGGLSFVPNFDPPQPEGDEIEVELPDYVNFDSFTEMEVVVGAGGEWELPGTLTMPIGDGPFPAIVIVHGSGPADRNLTVGPNAPYRDIAHGLASNGIAVLRYDKRTFVYKEQLLEITNLTVEHETIEDALLAVALLRETEGIDAGNIYVLGHSLGGYLAPRIGVADTEIAGLIVAAGNNRPLEVLILEQVDYLINLDGEVSDDEAAARDEIIQGVEAVRALTAESDTTEMILGVPVSYWLDLREYEPLTVVLEFPNPMLFLQGERDYQVTMVDFANWQGILSERDDVMFITYPALNHLFMAGEGESNAMEYVRHGYVDDAVITGIARWILANSAE